MASIFVFNSLANTVRWQNKLACCLVFTWITLQCQTLKENSPEICRQVSFRRFCEVICESYCYPVTEIRGINFSTWKKSRGICFYNFPLALSSPLKRSHDKALKSPQSLQRRADQLEHELRTTLLQITYLCFNLHFYHEQVFTYYNLWCLHVLMISTRLY